jgi:hypothetical protein
MRSLGKRSSGDLNVMTLAQFLNGLNVSNMVYEPANHTFTINPAGTTINVPLTKDQFPDHPPLKFMDEFLQIYEDVAVVLKPELELKMDGWADDKKKNYLINDKIKFFIGSKKRQMLGKAYSGRVGVTRSFEPYIFIGDYRFMPAQIKCVIKKNDLRLSGPAKSMKMQDVNGRNYIFDVGAKTLRLPSSTFNTGRELNDLVAFLKKARLI